VLFPWDSGATKLNLFLRVGFVQEGVCFKMVERASIVLFCTVVIDLSLAL